VPDKVATYIDEKGLYAAKGSTKEAVAT
jgi:hypothetical protein